MKKLLLLFLIGTTPLILSAKTEKIEKKSTFKCGAKKYCKQMKSCKEAEFYLKKCKLKRLDRDKDGIPCEKLCK